MIQIKQRNFIPTDKLSEISCVTFNLKLEDLFARD